MAAKRLALVFPGQGSQRVGMGKDLLENWPRIVGPVLEEASEAVQQNLQRLLFDGPQELLTQTQWTQPAILTHSIAVLRVLQSERELPPADFVLGHSLGEYSALVAANALSFASAAQLVHYRGRAMQETVAPGEGAMAALMPVSGQDAEEICKQAAEQTQAVCQVANYNSSKQIVISGKKNAVEHAIAIAKSEKKVRRAVLLEVSAPFHCTLMAPAALRLQSRLQQFVLNGELRSPEIPVVWNIEAETSTKSPAQMQDALTQQVLQPVRWSQSVDFCVQQDVASFVEIGFGGVLAGLIKQQLPPKTEACVQSCGTVDQIKAFLEA